MSHAFLVPMDYPRQLYLRQDVHRPLLSLAHHPSSQHPHPNPHLSKPSHIQTLTLKLHGQEALACQISAYSEAILENSRHFQREVLKKERELAELRARLDGAERRLRLEQLTRHMGMWMAGLSSNPDGLVSGLDGMLLFKSDSIYLELMNGIDNLVNMTHPSFPPSYESASSHTLTSSKGPYFEYSFSRTHSLSLSLTQSLHSLTHSLISNKP